MTAGAGDAAVQRGRRTTVLSIGVALVASVATSTVALIQLDYDWTDAPGSTLMAIVRWVAAPLVVLVLGGIVSSGRPWARWALTAFLAAGAAWVLVLADFNRPILPFALALAAAWGLGGTALALTPGVARFLCHRRRQWLTQTLGPLTCIVDSERWLDVLAAWQRDQLMSRREHRRATRVLADWLDAQQISPDRVRGFRTRLEELGMGDGAESEQIALGTAVS